MFTPGQRVECVDGSPAADGTPSMVVRGAIYIISDCVKSVFGAGVLLQGVPCPKPYIGWHAERFRPIVERKTDISSLEALLKPEKVDA